MKAELAENGELTITAETPTEALALRYWMNGYQPLEGEAYSSLHIVATSTHKDTSNEQT